MAGLAGQCRGERGVLHLDNRLGAQPGVVGRLAAADAEQPPGPYQVDDKEQVDHERRLCIFPPAASSWTWCSPSNQNARDVAAGDGGARETLAGSAQDVRVVVTRGGEPIWRGQGGAREESEPGTISLGIGPIMPGRAAYQPAPQTCSSRD